MSEFHRQCILERKNKDGSISRQCTWLPEKFAAVNKVVELKEGNEWEDGWIVKEVHSRKLSDEVNLHSRDFTKQRKASDI